MIDSLLFWRYHLLLAVVFHVRFSQLPPIVIKFNMGGITACCEHTVNAPFADGYKDPHLALEFVPADLTPEPKEAVKRRLQELATSTL